MGLGHSSSHIGHVRRLCASGLPIQDFVPELLRELHAIAPSHSNAIMLSNRQFDIVGGYGEDPAFFEVLPKYVRDYHDKLALEVMPPFSTFMRHAPTVTNALRVVGDRRRLERSSWYGEIVHPLGWRNLNYVKVFSGNRPIALIMQGMDERRKKITAREGLALTKLAPFIAHAMTAPATAPENNVDDDDVGILVVDADGRVQHVNAAAKAMLLWDMPALRRTSQRRGGPVILPGYLLKIIRDLKAASGKGDDLGDAPSHQHRSTWGTVACRAQWLQSQSENGAILVTLNRQVPLDVSVLRRIQRLNLPARQADTCYCLARGMNTAAIAHYLGLSIDAVNWHKRQIYFRLDVHNAAQLVSKLLSA